NGDDFSDVPYKSGDIFFNMTAEEPLLQIFFQSPAVYLWNKIEQFTPIPTEHFIIDNYSLVSPAPVQLDYLKSSKEMTTETNYNLLQLLFLSLFVLISGFILWKTRRMKNEN